MTRKKILPTPPLSTPRRRKSIPAGPGEKASWKDELFLYLEGHDPGLLDKETQKLYRRISDSGAKVRGPIPLPVRFQGEPLTDTGTVRIHRRLFHILSPTEKTVTLLEQLSLSGSVSASIQVEEERSEK